MLTLCVSSEHTAYTRFDQGKNTHGSVPASVEVVDCTQEPVLMLQKEIARIFQIQKRKKNWRAETLACTVIQLYRFSAAGNSVCQEIVINHFR